MHIVEILSAAADLATEGFTTDAGMTVGDVWRARHGRMGIRAGHAR
ncbi:hypothetical protein [Actinospica robiniae]|nr:hypothetical protein [Actinospica robiniae]